jgi:hypothetical protein
VRQESCRTRAENVAEKQGKRLSYRLNENLYWNLGALLWYRSLGLAVYEPKVRAGGDIASSRRPGFLIGEIGNEADIATTADRRRHLAFVLGRIFSGRQSKDSCRMDVGRLPG